MNYWYCVYCLIASVPQPNDILPVCEYVWGDVRADYVYTLGMSEHLIHHRETCKLLFYACALDLRGTHALDILDIVATVVHSRLLHKLSRVSYLPGRYVHRVLTLA